MVGEEHTCTSLVFLETSANLTTPFINLHTESSESESDVYEELLTPAEIQGHINKVNCKYVPPSGP